MTKYQCNVCGNIYEVFQDALLCHPDVYFIHDDDDLLARGAEHPMQPTPEQGGTYFWGCGHCGTGNWVTNDICANCKQPRPTRSGGS